MRSIDPPMFPNGKVLSKVQEQIVRGHGPTGKKIFTHPPLLKVVTVRFVCKNVYKEFATGFEEGMDLGQQQRVILHVFEHFHSHDQVIVSDNVERSLVVRHVALINNKE